MTAFSKAVIVDSQVFVPSTKGAFGLAIENTVEYLMREGRFESRGGLECEPTEMDLKLMAENGKCASLSDIADYGARQGKFEGRNPEIPMAPGEFSGGAWNEFGLVDVEAMKKEIIESGSNVMRTVISVPREWAPQFGLVTKAQWQELIRRCWPDSMADWKIMPLENQRWAAFFHTDNKVNLHVHILSWDSSGCFFTGEKRVARDNFFKSVETVKKAAYQKFSTARNLEKNYVRQALLLQAKIAYGAPIKENEIEAVRVLVPDGCKVGFTPECAVRGATRERLDALKVRLIKALPAEGIGRASYKGVNQEARAAANLSVGVLKKTTDVGRLFDRYVELINIGADILGKTGHAREEYVSAQVADINKRLANIVIKDAARENRPWTRDEALSKIRTEIIARTIAVQGSGFPRAFASNIIENKDIPEKAVFAVGYRAMDSREIADLASSYVDKVVEWTYATSEKDLLPEQIERLKARTMADLAEQIGERSVDMSYKCALDVIERKDSALLSDVVREIRYGRDEGLELYYMGARDRLELSEPIERAAYVCAKTGAIDKGLVGEIAARIMALPDVSSSLSIEADARVRSARGQGSTLSFSEGMERARMARAAVLEDKVEREIRKAAEYLNKKESYEVSNTLASLLGAALRTASSGGPVLRGGTREGMVRTRDKRKQHVPYQELSR